MLGFSPLSSAPLSALPLSRGSVIKESASAAASAAASVIYQAYTITESGSSSDSSLSGLSSNQTINESGTVTTSQDLFVPAFVLEGLYASDVSTTYKSFLGYQKSVINGDDGNALFDSWDFVRSVFGGGNAQILYANQKYGIAFTASRTAQLGKVALAQAFPNGGLTSSTTTAGAVELWQLAAAPGTATATSTLLASIPFYINGGYVNGSYSPLFDFSTVSGASLTNGTSYAILLAGGSDWVNTGNYATSGGLLFVSNPTTSSDQWYQEFAKYSSNYYIYYATSSTPIGASGTIASGTLWSTYQNSPIMTIEYASTAVDVENAINAIPITETVTASESLSQTNTAGAYINNTSPFLDTIVTSISTGTYPKAAIGEPITSGGYGKGLKFIANKTKTLSNIQINAYRINNSISSSTPPISTGKVELWQLNNNTLTGNPSTLLASRNFSLNDLPSPIQSMSSITNSLLGAASLTSSTTPTAGNNDDGYWTLSLPWSVNYLGNSYSTVFVGTNSYLTFGAGATQYVAVDAANPAVPKICISSTDNSAQRIYYGTEGTAPNRTYRIVFEGTANTVGTLGSPTLLWEAVFYENNTSQIDIQVGANLRGSFSGYGITLPDGSFPLLPTLWGVYSEEALVGAWPTTSYTNVGFRLVSKTTGYPYAYVPVNIDFSSANLSLTSGVAYAVTVTAGSDWSSSASSYLGLYRHDAVGYHNILTGGSFYGLPIYWYLRSVYTPIANNGSTWFAPSTDTNNIFRFTVNSTEESYATDIDVVAASTYYAADAEAGSALDSSVRAIPKFGLAAENFAVNAYDLGTGAGNYSSYVFPGNLTDGWGISFIAPKTGQLGSIIIPSAGAVGNGTTAGSIQLWQLASNSVTATPTTLLASKPLYITSSDAVQSTLIEGFSNVSGATVTAGVGYAIRFYKGTDWVYPTAYLNGINLINVYNSGNFAYYSSIIGNPQGSALGTLALLGVGYANIAADSTDALYLSQTQGYNEPLFATDSITQKSTVTAYTGQVHTSSQAPFLSTFSTPHGNGGYSVWGTTGGNLSCGRTFIAGFTGPVSYLEFDLINTYGGVRPAPVQTGYAQLWQLASNSISALPNTLLGQIAVMPSIATTSGGPVRIDFSSLNITLTSGVGYALAITAGSDWDLTNTQYLAVYANSDNLYIPYNSTPITRSANTGIWAIALVSEPYQFNMAVYSTYNTADVTDSSQVTTPFVGEQAAASDTLNTIRGQNSSIGERVEEPIFDMSPELSYTGTPRAGLEYAAGQTFISNYTGLVKTISLTMFASGSSDSTNPGYFQLWQLASNSISAIPSSLLLSYPVYVSDIRSSYISGGDQRVVVDVSSLGVSVTSGVAYGLVFLNGSDWNTTGGPSTVCGPRGRYIGISNFTTDYEGKTKSFSSSYPAASNTWYVNTTLQNDYLYPWTITGYVPSDTNTFTISAASAATEVGYSLDTSASLKRIPGAIVETSSGIAPLFNDYQFSTISGDANSMNANSRTGWGFTATTTGQLGKVSWVRSSTGGSGNYSNGNANPSVSNGALELWQLAGAPGTAATILVASIPVAATDFPSTGPAPLWDFSNISGAVLVAGISYAVIFSTGSDWNYTSTKTWSIQTQNSNGTDPAAWFGYRVGKTYYYGTGTVGTTTGLTSGFTWDTTTNPYINPVPPLSIEYSTNTSETPISGLLINKNITENSNTTATDSGIGNIPGAGETVYENVGITATDTKTTTVAFVSDRTETGTATETETSQANFYPVITENTGISATESGTQSTSGAVNTITETGSAIEAEDRTLTATRDVTETGTAAETEDRTLTATRDVTETGSANETEDRTLTATRDVTETGSANETEDRTLTATRDVTETGSANEQESNIITTSQSVTENTGISATDSGSNIISTTQVLTETGTATENETSQADFYPAITETGTATETESNKSVQYSSNLETTRKNIYANSDIFGSGWSVNNGTLTSTALTTDPFGGNGAYRLAEDTLNTIHREVYTTPHIAGTVYTLSVYVKADTRSKFVFFHEEGNSANRAGLQLDLIAGTKINYFTGTGTITSSTLTNEGNGWYRASFTFTATTNLSGVTHTFRLIDNLGNFTYTGDGTSGLFIYGPQFEIGSLTAYQANNTLDSDVGIITTNQSTNETGNASETETQTVFQVQYNTETGTATETETSQANFYPVITETGTGNESNSGSNSTNQSTNETGTASDSETTSLSALNQLWEYTSTNIIKYPNDISASPWTTYNSTLSTNVAVAPDGTQTADKIIGNSGVTIRKSVYYGGAYLTQNTTYTYSVYLKQAGFTNATIWFDIPFANIGPNGYQGAGALINLTDGSTSGTTPTVTTVTSVGNGWYRCSVTGTTKLPWQFGVAGMIPANLQISLGDANGVGTATGDGTSGIYVWGSQLELGSSVTAFVDPNETVTQTNVITTTQSLTETASASDSEISQANFYPAITETGTSADSPVGNWTTSSNSSETGSASETESTQIGFVSSLLENTNKNLFYVPSDLSNSIWIKAGSSTITSGQTDPNGDTTAFLLTANLAFSSIYNITPGILPGTYTVSVYVKYGTSTYFTIVNESTTGVDPVAHSATFTMSGTPVLQGASNATATLTSVGNSWYLATMTYTLIAGATFRPKFWVGSYSGTAFTGQTVYLWRPQVELGSSVTAFVDPNETVVQSSIITTNQVLTETGNASDSETSQANFYPVITETGTGNESNSGSSTTTQTRTETGSAAESESSSAAFVSSNTETGSASETETNIITTNQALTETGNASDSETSQANFYPAITETGNVSDTDSASAVDLGNIVETLLGQDLSTVQTAFISSIQEALNAIETDFGNNVSNRSAAEILSAVDSSTGLPFYAVNINELLNAVVSAVTALPAFITETGSLTAAQFATQLATAGILEQINANETELAQLILTSYVTEITVAGESTVVWIFYPMDYELVSSRPSMLIDSYSDEIYFDDIDVFYLDASKIMADIDVTVDQIYIDNIDVIYGNIALIDSAIDDEIYI